MATPRKMKRFFVREVVGGSSGTVGLVYEQPEHQHISRSANEAFKDMMQRCLAKGMGEEDAYWSANECLKVFRKHATALLSSSKSFRNTKSGSASRPNKRDPVKEVVIDAMRRARNADQALSAFIESMECGSVEEVRDCKKTGGSYSITVEKNIDEHRACKSRKTLERWWAKAISKRPTRA